MGHQQWHGGGDSDRSADSRQNTRMGIGLRSDRKVPKEFNKGGDSQSFVHSLDDIDPGGGAVMNLGRGKIAVWKDKMAFPMLFPHLALTKAAS